MKALALDIGTTQIKLGCLHDDLSTKILASCPTPTHKSDGIHCESNPKEWLSLVSQLLSKANKNVPLGIACQRSSFLLWDRITKEPLTPLISWRDRRAAQWCADNHDPDYWEKTGIPLSPHYAGPKLASLFRDDEALYQRACSGQLLFGTLDTWLIWCLSQERLHQIDISIAARTGLLQLGSQLWDLDILKSFVIPRKILPKLVHSCFDEQDIGLPYPLTASCADQAAAAFPLFMDSSNDVYINAGTGTFVMRKHEGRAPQGYLSAWLGPNHITETGYLWEGTINAGAALVNQLTEPLSMTHEAYALEEMGIGAPYWRPEIAQLGEASANAKVISWLFRIRQVVEDLCPEGKPQRVWFSGGLSARADLRQALADVLDCELWCLEQAELGVTGAACLAARIKEQPQLNVVKVLPCHEVDGYHQWRSWLEAQLHS